MPERSQNFLQKSEEKQFDESNDTKSLLKAKKEFTTASMKLMYQYATTKDYIFMSIAIISNAARCLKSYRCYKIFKKKKTINLLKLFKTN